MADEAKVSDESESAFIALAKGLHAEMERLDPTEDPNWEALTPSRKEFYFSCIDWLLDKKGLIENALASHRSADQR